MAKPVSDQLFRLIRNLTPAEKRYFKLYAARHVIGSKNEYLKLFEAIEKMQEYDESALRSTFRKLKAHNSFAIAKGRLYDTVMKSLDSFHAESSVDVELRTQLHYAEILYKKSLYDASARMLVRARRTAVKHERYTILLDIGSLEKKIIEKDGYASVSEVELQRILSDDLDALQRLHNYAEFWNLKSKLFFLLNRHGKVRDKKETDRFKQLIDNTLLKSEDHALSFESRYLYNHIYSGYYFGTGDYENSYIWLQKQLALMESNSDFMRGEPNKYFATLSNYIYLSTQLGQLKEIPVLLDKLDDIRSIPGLKITEDLAIKLFSTSNSTELSLYLQTGNFVKAMALVPEIEAGLKKFAGKLSKMREAFFMFNISVLYFANGELNKSLMWINRLLNDTGLDANQEVYAFARIFDLVVHLELGNKELLPYTLKSVQRYLTTRKRMYKFETAFLQFIKTISKPSGDIAAKAAYARLHEQLLPLKQDQFERMVFEYFDFISWVESKLTRKAYADIIRSKYTEKNGTSTLFSH